MSTGRAARQAVAAAAFALATLARAGDLLPPERGLPLPEFPLRATADWINSKPLAVRDLTGAVVLLEVWTSECVNCLRTLPWLKQVEARLGPRGLRFIGIHTPELPGERGAANVARRVRELGIGHPVMVDDDAAYWTALGNQWWPALYLVDKRGRMRALVVGEVHAGEPRAARIEAALESLLAE